ncbi:MAG: hypothetical protein ACRC3Z_12250 [Phocaeicola sp.]
MNRFLKTSLYMGCTILLIGSLAACSPTKNQGIPIEKGVSHELALFRKKHFENVNYQLHFSIPKELDKPVTGKVVITLQLKEREQIIVDFRGEASQITTLLLNGKEVPYEVVNEHILVQATEADKGTNSLAIDFIAHDQSLNRREEFL